MSKQTIIKDILDRYPQARDNDKLLILLVWYNQGIVIPKEIRDEILSRGLAPETITRFRRKLRETGHVQGSQAVEQGRYDKFVSIKGNSSLENLEMSL